MSRAGRLVRTATFTAASTQPGMMPSVVMAAEQSSPGWGEQARASVAGRRAPASSTCPLPPPPPPPSYQSRAPELKARGVPSPWRTDDGSTVDFKELATCTPPRWPKMMATIDTDRSGKVGRVEWIERDYAGGEEREGDVAAARGVHQANRRR